MTPWTVAHQASLSFTISQSLFRFMFIELMMPSNHFILCHPHLFLPSMFPSIRVFFNESALPIRWPKYYTVEVTNRSKELLLIEEAPRFHKAYPTSEVRYLTCQAMSLRTFRISATHQDFSASLPSHSAGIPTSFLYLQNGSGSP